MVVFHYAVHCGRICGIFGTWDEAKIQVIGFKGAKYRKFETRDEAEMYVSKGTLPPPPALAAPAPAPVSVDAECNVVTTIGMQPPRKRRRMMMLGAQAADDGVELNGNDSILDVYTDGACPNNGNGATVCGSGVYFGSDDDPRNISKMVPSDGEFDRVTNNIAELYAVQLALEAIMMDSASKPFKGGTLYVRINTDSKYVLQCIEKAAGQAAAKERVSSVPNGHCIEKIHNLLTQELPVHVKVKFLWVKGHGVCNGNNKADELARRACTLPVVAYVD